MAPKFPAEIDLFTVPHCRMKELVNIYTTKVQDMDYRNCSDVCILLKELQMTFNEFKSHESIENIFIMEELKNRLKQRHIYNSAVCDCHNDNRLQEMLTLVKNGKHLWKKGVGERLHFGHKLQKAFHEFVQKFLPHMEEEENIFQPLLVEYFEYEELRILKQLVLEQHELIKDPLYQEKAELDMPETDSAIKDLRDIDLDVSQLLTEPEFPATLEFQEDPLMVQYSDTLGIHEDDFIEKYSPSMRIQGDYLTTKYSSTLGIPDYDFMGKCQSPQELESSINFLPREIFIKIFTHLLPPDRGRCAQVCLLWNELIYSLPLWKEIYPVQWGRGIWEWEDVKLNCALDLISRDSQSMPSLNAFKQDEDADIDESEDSFDLETRLENDLFVSIVTYLLPRVGHGVEKIILDGGHRVNSRLLHQTLLLCPNVTHISAIYTFFDYFALKGLHLSGSLRRLKYLDLEGCVMMDDNALVALAKCLVHTSNQLMSRKCCLMNNCARGIDEERYNHCPNISHSLNHRECFCADYERSQKSPLYGDTEIEELHSLHRDKILPFSSDRTGEPSLEKINLSGCWKITNNGLISLLNSGSLQNITLLNLSSCFAISGEVLLAIARNCIQLQPENLTYCTSIDGPYISQVNGCDSIDHPLKFCCRSQYCN